jgi:hypothetical protein
MTRREATRLGRPPLPPGLKNERFSCYVPEAVIEGLDALADEHRTTRTSLVRAILTDYVAARRPLPEGVNANGVAQHLDAESRATSPSVKAGPPSRAGGRP